MRFIRQPEPIDCAEKVLPELVVGWINTMSVQYINIGLVQELKANMLMSSVIEWTKSWIPHWHTSRNFTHSTWAIFNMSNHDLFWIVPDPGRQQRITLSLESTSTIPCQARTSYVKILKWEQHSSNCGMPCQVSIFGTFQRTADQANQNQGLQCRCVVDIFLNSSNWEIHQAGMWITWIIDHVSLVGCTCIWHNYHSGTKLILVMPSPLTWVVVVV